MSNRIRIACGALGLLWMGVSPATASPQKISRKFAFQGVVSSVPDGTYPMQVTVQGGVANPTLTVAAVPVAGGVFSLVVDDATLDATAFLSDATGAPNITLDLKIDLNNNGSYTDAGDAAFSGIPVSSVPSAFAAKVALTARSLDASALVPAAQIDGTIASAANFSGSLSGDVAGTQTGTSVQKLRGLALPAMGAADAGKVLQVAAGGTSFDLVTPAGGGTNVQAGNHLLMTGSTLSVDSTLTAVAGKIPKLDGAGKIPLALLPSLDTATIGTGSVLASNIGTGAINTSHLGAGQVTSAKIADAAVGSLQMAGGIVGTTHLVDGSITSLKIATGAVGVTQLTNGAVTALKIATGAVGTGQIADGSITSAKIAAGAIGATAFVDGSITGLQLGAGAVGPTHLVNGAVGTAQIANDAVTPAKIPDGSITAAKLATGVVSNTPAGTVILSLSATPPTGYLALNGQVVSQSTYSTLLGFVGDGAKLLLTTDGSSSGLSSISTAVASGSYLATAGYNSTASQYAVSVSSDEGATWVVGATLPSGMYGSTKLIPGNGSDLLAIDGSNYATYSNHGQTLVGNSNFSGSDSNHYGGAWSGSKYVIFGTYYDSGSSIYRFFGRASSDGATWDSPVFIASVTANVPYFQDTVAAGGTIVTATDQGLWTSSNDGVAWSSSQAGVNFASIGHNGSTFCALKNNSTQVVTSANGTSWSALQTTNLPISNSGTPRLSSMNGYFVIGVTPAGVSYPILYASADCQNWSRMAALDFYASGRIGTGLGAKLLVFPSSRRLVYEPSATQFTLPNIGSPDGLYRHVKY
jgi:hypothetical protein